MTCILKPPEVQISVINPLHDLNTIISQFDGSIYAGGGGEVRIRSLPPGSTIKTAIDFDAYLNKDWNLQITANATDAEKRDLRNELQIMATAGEHANLVTLMGACTEEGTRYTLEWECFQAGW